METIIHAINAIREEIEYVNANSPTFADADPSAVIAVGVVVGLTVIAFIGFVILDKKLRG